MESLKAKKPTKNSFNFLSKLLFVFLLVFSTGLVFGQTAGPNFPSSTANVSNGTVSWSNTGNIVADNSSIATAIIPKDAITDYLVGTNYGFSIPGTATIVGIIVDIDNYTTGSKTYDNNLYLTKDGTTTTGSDYAATGTKWQTSETTASYGGSADLWGTTWTPTEVNSSNFGIMFTVTQASNSTEDAYVDYISITIHYTLPPCTSPTTQATIGSFTNNTTGTTLTANWTRGNGDNILVVARLTSDAAVAPTSGNSYTANTAFGSGNTTGTGNYVVYNGTGTSVDVTALTAETGYTFDIYEYNNTDVCYNTTASSGAVTTPVIPPCTSPTTQATIGSFTNNGTGTTLTANWTRGNGNNILVVARLTSDAAVAPTSGNSYTANTAFGSGNTTGTGNYVVYNGTGTSVDVTGLTAETGYTFDIYEYNNTDVCYNTTASSDAVTTPALSTAMPFTEGFESGFGSFTVVNGSTNQWEVGTATACTGSQSAYVSDDGGTNNSYDNLTSSVSHFYTDLALPAGSNPFNLKFSWKGEGESTYDYVRVFMTSTSTTPVAGTLLAADQVGDSYYNQQSTWQTANIELAAGTYAGNSWRLVFSWTNDGSVGTDPPLAIDDIEISIISCPDPSVLSATSIAATQANLGWTEGGSATTWDIELGATGFSATGTPTQSGVSSNPYTYTGLTSSTTYEFYVRSDCGGSDYSSWAGPFEFTTACATKTPAWSEDFASYLPNCWAETTGILASPTTTSGTTSAWADDGFANSGTTGAARINIYGTTYNEWLITPSIDLGGGGTNYQLEFDLALTDYGSTSAPSGVGTDDKFVVIISTDNGSTWTDANTLQEWTNSSTPTYASISTTGEGIIIDLTGYTGVVQFGFYGESTVSNEDNDLFVDNVKVIEIPSCPVPISSSATAISASGATANWSGGTADYIVEYGLNGFTPGTGAAAGAGGTIINISAGNFSTAITGLSDNTDYSYYIRQVCAGPDYSDNSTVRDFTTQCIAYTVPYFEGFESGYTDGDDIAGCLSQETILGSATWEANNSNTLYNRTPKTGSYNATLYYSNDDWIFIAIDLINGEDYEVSLYARQDMSTSTYADISIAYGNSNTAAAMTNSIVSDFAIIDGNYQEVNGYFTAPSTGTFYIGILGSINGSPYYISMDDISIDVAPSCVKPSDLASAAVTANTADLSWTASISTPTDGYDIYYSTSSTAPDAGTTPTATVGAGVTTYNMTSLTSISTYYVWVRSDCSLGDLSDWYGPINFLTACGNIVTYPWTEAFDTYLPYCWSEFEGTLASPTTTSGTTSSWIEDGFANDGSTGAAKINIYGTTYNEWLVTPSIDLGSDATDYQLEFDLALTDFGNTDAPEGVGADDKFVVVISTDDGTTWTSANTLQEWTNSSSPTYANISSSGERITIDLSAYSNVVKIGFYGESLVSNNDNDLFIDNVTIVPIQDMEYVSSSTIQNIASIAPGATNEYIIAVTIDMLGNLNPLSATDLSFNTNGTTSVADISNATLWYTGTNSSFTTSNQFGSIVAAPNGSFSFNSTQELSSGTNYFWLTYDIPSSATFDNLVDVECNSITIGSAQTPNPEAPSGSRTIGISYCDPAPSSVDNSGITNVTCGSINNTTGTETNNYGDYSAQSTDVSQGVTVPVYITYSTSYTYYTKIWIDWNKDGDFDDTGEEVYSGESLSANPTTLAASFTVPAAASTGNHRMRIGGADSGTPIPCYTGTYGSYEDYTINVIIASDMAFSSSTVTQTNTNTVALNSFTQEIIGVEIETTGSLNPIDVSSFTFNITGTTNTADIANATLWTTGTSGIFATTTQLGDLVVSPVGAFTINSGTNLSYTLNSGTNYFWLTYDIVSTATIGNFVDAVCTSIIVDSNPETLDITDPTGERMIDVVYCAPVYTSSCSGDYISNVTFSTIDNTTICSGSTPSNFTYYTTPNPSLTIGNSYNLSVTTDGDTEGVTVWIDYNHDGAYTSNEIVLTDYSGSEPATYNTTVTIPGTALATNTRMRVRGGYNAAPTDACSSLGYGETEDYMITIISGCTPPDVTAISPSATTICSGDSPATDFSLTVSGGETPGSYTYQWYKDGTLVAGATSATYNPGVLTAETSVYCMVESVGCSIEIQSPTGYIFIDSPFVSANVSTTAACSGTTLTLSGNPSGMTSYTWSGPTGCTYDPNNTSQNPTVTIGTTSGAFTLTVTSSNGCTASTTTETVTVTAAAPSCATTPSPADAAIDIAIGTSITWAVDANATSYDVYFGIGSIPSSPTTNITGTTYTPSLTENTNYIWKIVPRNGCGAASGCTTEWDFSTIISTCSGTGTAIDPSADGGFEDGASLDANNWYASTSANISYNQFVCNTGATAGFSGANCAYVTNDAGGSPPAHDYEKDRIRVTHLYRDFYIPSGASNIKLNFDWIGEGEGTKDFAKVWLIPSYYTPTYESLLVESGTDPYGIIQIGDNTYSSQATWASSNDIIIPDSYAGLSSVRLVFEWINNDNSTGTNPPFAVDNVSIIYNCPLPDCDLSGITFSGTGSMPALDTELNDGILYIDVCQGDILDITPAPATNNYDWLINAYDGTGQHRFTDETLSYEVLQASGYDGFLIIDGGATCYSWYPVRIRSSAGPTYVPITVTFNGCAGTKEEVNLGSEITNEVRVEPFLGAINSALGVEALTYIPDGPYCNFCYESEVTFTDFPVGSTIETVEDILYLRILMEHSNMADIQVSLIGPNECGQAIILQDYPTFAESTHAKDNDTYFYPYATTDRIAFGIPYEHDLTTSGQPCNPQAALNYEGTGWEYCWSWNDDYNYTSGYVYSAENHQHTAGLYIEYTVEPSDYDNNSNFYHPFETFDDLVGCPLNGVWSVQVCDCKEVDNGWVFDWELGLSVEHVDNYWEYDVDLSHVDWTGVTCVTPTAVQEDTNPLIYDLMPNMNSAGDCTGTFTIYDEFSCNVTSPATTFGITPLPTVVGIANGDYIWAGMAINAEWNNNSTISENWYYWNGSNYDYAASLPLNQNVFIVDFCSNTNPGLTANSQCNNLTILAGKSLNLNASTLNVSGNWENSGTFNSGTGTINFNGSVAQTINTSTAGGETFYDLTINNSSSGITFNQNALVTNILNMTSGNIITGANVITLGTNVTNLGTLTRTSGTVIGDIRRWFAASTVTNVLFPVGIVTNYRPATISFTTALTTGGTLTTGFVAADPGINGLPLDDGGNLVEMCAAEGYWPIIAGDGLAGGVYDLDLEATGFGVNDYTQLWLIKRANAASAWTLNGAHETATGSNALPVVHRNDMANFSEFGVGGKDASLPIELLFFTAECNNNNSIIEWATASETNNNYFIIEKSIKLEGFYEIARIPSTGNSSQDQYYSITDNKLFEGDNYYRIKQVDYNGRTTTYKIISLNCDQTISEDANVITYPNPFGSTLNLHFTNLKDQYIHIEIIDELGKVIMIKKLKISENIQVEILDLEKLKPAVYYLKAISKDKVFYNKIIKQ